MALASRKLTSKIYEVQAHSQKVTCLDLGQTGRVLVTGGQDRNVNLWAFGNDKCFMSLTGHNGQIDCVKFAYNDDYVYSSDENGIIKRWDLNAQPECSTFYGHMKSVRTLDFHPYGEYVVSGSNDTTVRLWDVRNNNNCIKKYRGHIANVNSVKFSPDGSWIASAGTEGSVIIWDIRMSKQIIEFLEHASPVTCIQFHPFEFLLAAGRNDGTVDLYDLESRQLISRSGSKSPFNGHTVKCVTFSETGKCLFVGTAAGISVIGWEPDRNYDHIDSSWSLLGDMKVINQKLFCGSFENKSVDIHAIHLNQVIPYYNPSNVQFNQNQSSRKSFSRGNQKLRLSIGNNTSSSNNNNIITTISTPPSTIDNLNNEINIQQNSDGGMSSPNLSIEMIDETEEHPQLSNGFPFNNNNNNNNTNKYNKSQQNTTTTTTTAGNTNVTTTNLYESLPSIDNYKYDNYVLGDGPSSLKLSNESSSSSSKMVPQTITTDISIDTYTSDLDYYPMRSSPSLFNNVSDPEREDFPVNNAQPPDYAPKMDQHLNKTVLSKYKINSQLQQRKQQSQSINSNNIHINQSLSNNNNSNNNNNNINNMKSFAQQTRKFSNLSTSISTIDLHKLSDETMNNGKKHLISSRTSSPVRNYIGSNKLKKNDTTTMTTLNSTTQQLNKENNIRNNRKINVQILLPPNKPPPPRSKTSLDLRATSVSQAQQQQQQQQHQQQQILQQQQQQHQSQSYSHTQTTSSTYLQSTSIATPTSPFAQRSSSNYSNNNNNNNNTSQYQSTSSDESTEMRILTSYHERVSQELSNRHATLQLIRNSTRANDIVGALKQSIKINDRSILVDLLGAILEKTGSWNLDMCLFLLPEIYDLLQSEHKFHCTRGCDTLRVILSNFLPVIRENTGPWGIPISLGVDISGEERHKKCMDCRQWLLRIKNLPENQYMGSNLMQLQNLIVDL